MLKEKESFTKKIINFFLNLLFPVYCYDCQKEGQYLCDKCFKKLSFQEKSLDKAKLLRDNLSDIFIVGDYNNKVLAKLIRDFKYKGLKEIGFYLARFLIFFWQGKIKRMSLENKDIFSDSDLLVIPMPLSRKRKRERSFNQAEILAEIFCQEFSYKLFLDFKRRDKKNHQVELNREDRLKNVENIFYCPKNQNIIFSKKIIIIDDVITTGASLNELAAVLLDLGAVDVFALVLAKS